MTRTAYWRWLGLLLSVFCFAVVMGVGSVVK